MPREFDLKIGDAATVNGGEDLTVVGLYHCGSLLLDVAIIVDQEFVRQVSRFDPYTVCSFYVEPTGEIPNDEIVAQDAGSVSRSVAVCLDADIADLRWQPVRKLVQQQR